VPCVNAGDNHGWGAHDRRPVFTSVVDDHQALFEQDAGSRLKPNDACTVGAHFIRAEALRIRNGYGERALHVGDLAEASVAVVVAKDDTDHRLDQPSWRRPRALNLNAVVAAHGGLAALFP